MAAPPQGDSSYHPEPRCGAASFTIGRKLFTFRGALKSYQHKTKVELPRAVEVFDAETLVWNNVDSVGDHPPWFQSAAVTTCKNDAFFFGGHRGTTGYCNDLFALNSTNMSFRRLPGSGEDTRVLRTARSGLVSLATGNLLTVGGHAEQPTHQTAADFYPDPGDSRGRGYTNQLLHYNTESGDWSCPTSTGRPPPASSDMTLTRVDRRRVVWFGGYDGEGRRQTNAVFILDTVEVHWRGPMLPQSAEQPWPEERQNHTAYSMWDPDSDPVDPCLVMAGGARRGGDPLGDVWILHINNIHWDQVLLPPGGLTPRWDHAGGVIYITATLRLVVIVGGVSDNHNKYDSLHDYPLLSDTTVLELEYVGGEWSLKSILSGSDLEEERQRRGSQLEDVKSEPGDVGRVKREEKTEPMPRPVSAGEVGPIHIKIEPKEEEEPLSEVVLLQRKNTEWIERCQELEAKNEELQTKNEKLEADNKKLRERLGEGDWEEGDRKEREYDGSLGGKAGLEKESRDTEDRHSSPENVFASIRGADIVARTTLTLAAGEGRTYEWKGHGLRMQVPAGALELHSPLTTMTIQASLSGHYQLPDHAQLVSGVYWISFPGKFSRPVTLEVQHCTFLQSAHETAALSFVTAKCNQETLPYSFRPIAGGIFSADCRFGTIELSHFSCFAIVLWVRRMGKDGREEGREEGREVKGKGDGKRDTEGEGNEEGGQEVETGEAEERKAEGGGTVEEVGDRVDGTTAIKKQYAALTYYIPQVSPTTWLVHFPIIPDLDLCMKIVQVHYLDKQAEEGPGVKMTISGSQVAVDVPEAGIKLPSGWTLEPLVTPHLTRETVDSYKEGQKIPCFELELEWEGEKRRAKKLSHVLHFTGVKPQGTFIRITRPAVRASPDSQQRLAARRKRPGSQHGEVEGTSSKRLRESDGATSGNELSRNALDIDDLYDVKSELIPVAGEWRNIGLALKLKDTQLCVIQRDNPDVTSCLTDMLRQWLNKTYDVNKFRQPSWQILAEAVRCPAGGNNPALAARIHTKHGDQ